MQKIYTFSKLGVHEEFYFNGNPKELLGNGDCVDIWSEKDRNGLGEEVIYGWAKITQVIEPNFYKAVRMPNV